MDIAIIGMAGRFPEAAGLTAFRENLRSGKDSIRRYSRKRLRNTTVPYKPDYELFAYLEDIDRFDYEFFGISLGEAQHIDPHQRLLMEVAYEAFENAGYSPAFFDGTNTSLYVSNALLEYARHAVIAASTLSVGNLNAVTAGRVSRFFNLRGPAVMVDTACSSSLVAVHLACKDLIYGDADYAMACGVNIKLFPGYSFAQTDIGIASPDGRTKAFSAGANGTGSGEAIGCVLLKPLHKAIEDKDIIHAVIKGSAVNQDAGLSGSLTAPSSQAQSEVIIKAWKNAGIDPATVSSVEAHGTGTRLGDPIEIQGLDLAFSAFTAKKQFCAVSSVKTNVGHTNSAAGITSFIKAVLSVKHKELYPSLNFEAPNPFIDFEHSATYINTSLQPWDTGKDGIRRAGVSAFGIAGTNCHIVLEEAMPSPPAAPSFQSPYLFTVSGKTRKTLTDNIQALTGYLLAADPLMEDLSFTLNTGRKHYEERFATVATTKEALLEQLFAWKDGQLKGNAGKKQEQRFVFIFSASLNIAADVIDSFAASCPLFAVHYNHCYKRSDSKLVQEFAFRYAFFKMLEAGNISCKTLIGDGLSEIAVAVISGRITLEAGVAQAIAYSGKRDTRQIEERCAALLARFEDEPCTFIEMGPMGNISGGLKSLSANVIVMESISLKGLMQYLQQIYLSGMQIEWGKGTHFFSGQRIELPGYQFDSKHCWIKEPGESFNDWFYQLSWKEVPALPQMTAVSGSTYLIWMNEQQSTAGLIGKWKAAGCNFIEIWPSADGYQKTAAGYSIRKEAAEDYIQLAADINTAGFVLSGFVNLWDNDHYVAVLISAAFSELLSTQALSWINISLQGHLITPEQSFVDPLKAIAGGCMLTLHEEYPLLKTLSIDVDEDTMLQYPEMVCNELYDEMNIVRVGYRNGKRYLPVINKQTDENNNSITIQEHGVYIITGGAGGIGMEICRYIGSHRGTVILLDKYDLPEEEWPLILKDPVHPAFSIVQQLTQLRQHGISLYYYQTDIADKQALQTVITLAEQLYGTVQGAFHLAGNLAFTPLSQHTRESFDTDLKPFVQGALALADVLEQSGKWLVFFTSYHSIAGETGRASYSAAGMFLDELQHSLQHCINIKWPGWIETGMWANVDSHTGSEWMAAPYISNEEGIEILDTILRSGIKEVMVAADDPALLGNNPYFLLSDYLAPVVVPVIEPLPVVAPVQEKRWEGFTETESLLADIWQDILKPAQLLQEDDFFDLGGHSLNGTQVISKIQQNIGVKIDFDVLLEYGTLREVAAFIDALPEKVTTKNMAIPPVPLAEYYELSHAQQRLWISDQLETNLVAYNMSAAYVFEGEFYPDAFMKAFDALIDRHEILRTTFTTVAGKPVQQIHDAAPGTYIFLKHAAEEDVTQLIVEDAQTPFDLEKGPLIRAHLIALAADRHIFFFTVHHIIGDGWSMKVIADDILRFYNASCKNEPYTVPPLKIQYKDFAAWQNSQLQDVSLLSHQQYWREQFATAVPVITFPSALPRPALRTYEAARRSFLLDEQQTIALRQLSNRQDATVYMTLLSSLNLLLYCYTQQQDIVIGTPVAGRDHPDLENQIGLYLNTLPMRTSFGDTDTFITLVKRTKETVLNGFKHQLFPLDKIIADLKYDKNRNPLFDVGFTCNIFSQLQGDTTASDTNDAFDKINAKSIDSGHATVKADLWWHVSERGTGLAFNLDYNIALFDDAFAAKMLNDYMNLLQWICAEPDTVLKTLAVRIKKERQQSVRSRNLDTLNNFK